VDKQTNKQTNGNTHTDIHRWMYYSQFLVKNRIASCNTSKCTVINKKVCLSVLTLRATNTDGDWSHGMRRSVNDG